MREALKDSKISYMNTLTQFIDSLQETVNPLLIFKDEIHHFVESGNRLRGCSPWRESKSGTSFWVNTTRNTWNDPGCGVGGTMITYIHKLKHGVNAPSPKGQEYVDAATELCRLAGVEMPQFDKKLPELTEAERLLIKRERALQGILALAIEHLQTNDAAKQYLYSRGHTDATIAELRLGLMPNDLPAVIAACLMADLTLEEAATLNLIGKSTKDSDNKNGKNSGLSYNGYYIQRSGYLVFPWCEANGNLATLYFRSVGAPTGKNPKAVCLPNPSGVLGNYKSKQSLFYYDRAKKAGLKDLVLVEGLNDAALAQALGDNRVVGCVGAQTTDAQYKQLSADRINSVTICLDPDASGDKNTPKTVRRLATDGILSYVCERLPNGQDPDEFIIEHGIEAWRKYTDSAIHGFTAIAQQIAKETDYSKTGKALNLEVDKFVSSVNPSLHCDLEDFFYAPLETLTQRKILRSQVPFSGVLRQESSDPAANSEIDRDAIADTESAKLIKLMNRYIALKDAGGFGDVQLQTDICTEYKLNHFRFKEIVDSIRAANEAELTKRDELREFFKLSVNASTDFNLYEIFPKELATILDNAARDCQVGNGMIVQPFMSAVSSLIGNTKIWLNNTPDCVDGWWEPAILHTLVITQSGAGKSHSQDAVLRPIHAKQKAEDIREKDSRKEYDVALRNYKNATKEDRVTFGFKSPDPDDIYQGKRYAYSDGTLEGVLKDMALQPEGRGQLWVLDEASKLACLDQYKARGGDSKETLNSLYNGRTVSMVRSNREQNYAVHDPRLSITGGIQPDKAYNIYSDHQDADGFQARFLPWFNQKAKTARTYQFNVTARSNDLAALYDALEVMNLEHVKLSHEACNGLFAQYANQAYLAVEQCSDNNPALANFIVKSVGAVGRVALDLHHLEHCYQPKADPFTVDSHTVARAIKMMLVWIANFKALQAHMGVNASLSQALLQLSTYADRTFIRTGEGVSVSNVASSTVAKWLRLHTPAKSSSSDIRAMMQELEAAGYGTIDKTGSSSNWIYTPFDGKTQKRAAEKAYLQADASHPEPIENHPLEVRSTEPTQSDRSQSADHQVEPQSEAIPGDADDTTIPLASTQPETQTVNPRSNPPTALSHQQKQNLNDLLDEANLSELECTHTSQIKSACTQETHSETNSDSDPRTAESIVS